MKKDLRNLIILGLAGAGLTSLLFAGNPKINKTWTENIPLGVRVYTSGESKDKKDYVGMSVLVGDSYRDFPAQEVNGSFKIFWDIKYKINDPWGNQDPYDLHFLKGKPYTTALWDEQNPDGSLKGELDRKNGQIPNSP